MKSHAEQTPFTARTDEPCKIQKGTDVLTRSQQDFDIPRVLFQHKQAIISTVIKPHRSIVSRNESGELNIHRREWLRNKMNSTAQECGQ